MADIPLLSRNVAEGDLALTFAIGPASDGCRLRSRRSLHPSLAGPNLSTPFSKNHRKSQSKISLGDNLQERMKPQVAGPMSIHWVADGNLLEKLEQTFPEETRWMQPIEDQLRFREEAAGVRRRSAYFPLVERCCGHCRCCCSGVLARGVAGGAIKFLFVIIPARLAFHLTGNLEQCFFSMLATLCATLLVVSMFNIICALVVSSILICCCASGALLFNLAFALISALVRIDVQLANSISSVLRFDSVPENVPQPEECAKRFENDALRLKRFEEEALDHPYAPLSLPVIALATRLRMIVLYFVACKAIIGGLSTAAIFCCVVQPAMSIFSGGHAPIFSSSMTFDTDPMVYVLVVISSCATGGVGLGVVAALSTKLTWRAFGDRDVDQAATPDKDEQATSYTE